MLQLKIKASELTGLAYRELLDVQRNAEKAAGGVRELVKRHFDAKDYAVKITAKEYKGTSKLPIIYQVKAKKMRGLHARGASLGKTSSTAQIPYSFFESQSQP